MNMNLNVKAEKRVEEENIMPIPFNYTAYVCVDIFLY